MYKFTFNLPYDYICVTGCTELEMTGADKQQHLNGIYEKKEKICGNRQTYSSYSTQQSGNVYLTYDEPFAHWTIKDHTNCTGIQNFAFVVDHAMLPEDIDAVWEEYNEFLDIYSQNSLMKLECKCAYL